jgi:hypothetical protein
MAAPTLDRAETEIKADQPEAKERTGGEQG